MKDPVGCRGKQRAVFDSPTDLRPVGLFIIGHFGNLQKHYENNGCISSEPIGREVCGCSYGK